MKREWMREKPESFMAICQDYYVEEAHKSGDYTEVKQFIGG